MAGSCRTAACRVPSLNLTPIDGGAINEVPLDKLPDAAGEHCLGWPCGWWPASTPSYRKLVADDLPATATQSGKGWRQRAAAGGLAVDANGAVSIGNTVSPGTNPLLPMTPTAWLPLVVV